VRDQTPTQRVRQVVDQGDVAEDVFLAQVDPVRFERVEAVRGEDQDLATLARDPQRFLERLAVVFNVLDNLVEQDRVKDAVRERQRLADRADKATDAPSAPLRSLEASMSIPTASSVKSLKRRT
jgi:hypothetical protein